MNDDDEQLTPTWVKLSVKPDAAMVYAALVLRLRAQGLPVKLRAELQHKARHLRRTLTAYELGQVRKLISLSREERNPGFTGTLDLKQAAAIAKCHPDHLRQLAKARKAPATKIGRRWVFVESQLLEWIAHRCQQDSVSSPATAVPSSGSALDEKYARVRARRLARIASRKRGRKPTSTPEGDV